MKSDDALWLAREVREGCFGDVAGVLIVYVDDLAFLGPEDLCWQFVTAIRAKWKTSDPEWIGERPTTFCGIELSRSEAGFRMTQRAYTQELLNRYNVDEEAGVPIAKWTEPESTEPVRADRVKEAQALTGALLWLSTRTRPDLAYVVSRCGQQATKCPDLSIALGRQALAYLKSTIDMGIDVPFEVGSVFSDHGLLSLPRTDRVLELYTDASHSPNGERSTQSVFLLWRGVPAAWESTRQPFVTLSSAESELVCMMHGVKLAEAVQPLIDELIEGDSIVSLLGDNEAAIRAFESTPSGWRNRHLRMRALAGRERVSANLLKETWPYVGTWLRLHYFAQLLSLVGEGILQALGERAEEWLVIRCTSPLIRIALAGSVADALRKGPYVVMFSGPQWQEAVEEYILTGYPVDDATYPEGTNSEGGQGAPVTRVSPSFPYIEWPPGIYIHYLWRVFTCEGYLILMYLGTRVSEWGYLRATACEFRSAVLYGLIRWLRETGVQRMSDPAVTSEAAGVFLQTGTRTFPFEEEEEVVDDGEAPVVRELSDSSSSSESAESSESTAEPSVVSLSDPASSAEVGEPEVHGNLGGSVSASAPPVASAVYAAGEEVLWGTLADDTVAVPLPGWSQEEIETICFRTSYGVLGPVSDGCSL
eukprot:s3512_g7.t1